MSKEKDEVMVDENKVTELIENGTRISGAIILLAKTKGYGFIESREIPFTRIFFHWSALDPIKALHFTKLRVGLKVEFELTEDGLNRLQATRIHTV